MYQRILNILLACSMVVSVCSLNAFAGEIMVDSVTDWDVNGLEQWFGVDGVSPQSHFELAEDTEGISRSGYIAQARDLNADMYHDLPGGINAADPAQDTDYYIYIKMNHSVEDTTINTGSFNLYLLNKENMGTRLYTNQAPYRGWEDVQTDRHGLRPTPGEYASGAELLSGYLPSIQMNKWYNWLWKIHIPAEGGEKNVQLKVWEVGTSEPEFLDGKFTYFQGQVSDAQARFKTTPIANVVGFKGYNVAVSLTDICAGSHTFAESEEYNEVRTRLVRLKEQVNEGSIGLAEAKALLSEIEERMQGRDGVLATLAIEEYRGLSQILNDADAAAKRIKNILDKWSEPEITTENVSEAYDDIRQMQQESEKLKIFAGLYQELSQRIHNMEEQADLVMVSESYRMLLSEPVQLENQTREYELPGVISSENERIYYLAWEQNMQQCKGRAGLQLGDLFAGAELHEGKISPMLRLGETELQGDTALQLGENTRYLLKITADGQKDSSMSVALTVISENEAAVTLTGEWNFQSEISKCALAAEQANTEFCALERQEHSRGYDVQIADAENVVITAEIGTTVQSVKEADETVKTLIDGIVKNYLTKRIEVLSTRLQEVTPDVLSIGVSGEVKAGGSVSAVYEMRDPMGVNAEPEFAWYIGGAMISEKSTASIPRDAGGKQLYCRITPVSIYGKKGTPKESVKQTIFSTSQTAAIRGGGGGGGGSYSPSVPVVTAPEIPVSAEADGQAFVDILGHWAADEIRSLAELGVVNGTETREFKPDDSITRAEFIAIAVRALGLENVRYRDYYNDITQADWFADAVYTATLAGLISGNDGYFYPQDNITREEMAKVVVEAWEYLSKEELPKERNSFRDRMDISSWALDYVAAANKLGLIQGVDDKRFAPRENATRAQTAVIFKRLLDMNIPKPEAPAEYMSSQAQAKLPKTIDDTLTDWSKASSHSDGLEIRAEAHPEEGVLARVFRKDANVKEIVYRLGADITDFNVLGYASGMRTAGAVDEAYAVYLSKDGKAWEQMDISNDINARSTGSGDFVWVDIKPADELKKGYCWLKIECGGTSAAWANQIARVKIN